MSSINHIKAREFGSLEFLAKQVVEGFITGLHKSPFHGFSVEFSEHKLYNKGESTRNIDWKLFARTDKLYVKRYEEETNLRCQIVIDTSSSMYFPAEEKNNKLSFSIDSAAALIYLMRKQRDAVGLSIFSDQILLHTKPKSSTTNQRFLFAELEKLLFNYQPKGDQVTDLVSSLHSVAEGTHKRSLIVVFSDFMGVDNYEDVFGALQHLRHNKHEVVVFDVFHKSLEGNLDFENRPYTFIDMESGNQIKLNPLHLKEEFLKKMNSNKLALKNTCGNYKIDYVEADISLGFNQVLMQYLVKRQKMI
jgi:uncharacterized protein (DUF58 family)